MPFTFSLETPSRIPLSIFFLRLGFVFVFSYTAYEGILHPEHFAKWVHPSLITIAGAYINILLYFFFMLEIGLVLWLVSGTHTHLAALIIVSMLAGITLTNMDKFEIVFRNVGLVCAALALFVLAHVKER